MRRGRLACGAFALAALLGVPTQSSAALPKDVALDKKLGGRKGEPGSGAALDKQLRGTDTGRLKSPLPRRARDESEAAGIDDIEALAARYRAANEAMAHTVAQQLVIEASEGKKLLNESYERQIRDHEAKARKLRALAVRRYEDFLSLHPNDATWTPEIMFRLAELHFESASERLGRQEDAFEKELLAYQERLKEDENAQPPIGPKADYSQAIAMFRGVAVSFPRYRLGDAALYMMGTLLQDMESFDESRQSYLALACGNRFSPPVEGGGNLASDAEISGGSYAECVPWKKDSTYTAEAWLRIGEIHYDLDEFDLALQAYKPVTADPEGELYDEALIRMGWALYLKRSFADAALKFDEFIRYADTYKGQKKADGAVALRGLAVNYVAKTYIEPDWNGDGRDDRISPFARLDRDYRSRGKERHVPEIYAALGDLYAVDTDYKTAIGIWKTILARWPLTPAAPGIQLRVMDAYAMLQDKNGATAARDQLATNYVRGTKWFYANEDDTEVIEKALALAEDALVATAVDHHERAQELRADGQDTAAAAEYTIAATAYKAYLERFPDTPSSYEYRYSFAESLYYSDQFADAAKEYAEVRDSNLDDKLQEDAADGAVMAYERLLEEHGKAGTLILPAMPKQGAEGPFEEQAMPDLVVELQKAYDRFVVAVPASERVPVMMYLAGELAQKYYHFDEAQRRFEGVLDDHCNNNVAIKAGTAIIDSHIVREDLESAGKWTKTLLESGCGEGDAAMAFAGELKTIGNAVIFQEATLLYDAGEFEAAADRYVALVDQAPDDKHADSALNNAAVAYEKVGRFQSASQTYQRIYKSYPDSEFADDALLREGYNHSKFFAFDEAVKSYLVLAEDDHYKDSAHRTVSLRSVADLLDNLQDYKRSAQYYDRYASVTEDQAEAAKNSFRAAEVMQKTDDHRATVAAYKKFLTKYGEKPENSDKAVGATLRIGQAYAAMGKPREAKAQYLETVRLFEARKLKPGTEAADYPAEAQFLLAEFELDAVEKMKLTATGKRLQKQTKSLFDALVATAGAYNNVLPYLRIDWALAAMYRRGYAFEATAQRVREAPVPKVLRELSEPWFAYKDDVDKFANQAEGKAIGLYQETIKRGKEYNIANEWTRSARERLNIYMPDEFPLLRTPALELQLEDLR